MHANFNRFRDLDFCYFPVLFPLSIVVALERYMVVCILLGLCGCGYMLVKD